MGIPVYTVCGDLHHKLEKVVLKTLIPFPLILPDVGLAFEYRKVRQTAFHAHSATPHAPPR